DGARREVARENRRLRGRAAHAVARRLLQALPCRSIEPRELLETERAREPWRAGGGDQRGLDGDGAAAAHRIEQRQRWRPAGQRKQAGGQILAQRRFFGVAPVAALEQGLARRIDVDRRVTFGEIRADPLVGLPLVDRRAHTRVVAHAVAYGILHAQRGELEALQG